MKEEHDNYTGLWVTLAVGLPLLYMLSIGPVAMVYRGRPGGPPNWLETAYFPLEKLVEHNKTAKGFYEAYFKLLGVR